MAKAPQNALDLHYREYVALTNLTHCSLFTVKMVTPPPHQLFWNHAREECLETFITQQVSLCLILRYYGATSDHSRSLFP